MICIVSSLFRRMFLAIYFNKLNILNYWLIIKQKYEKQILIIILCLFYLNISLKSTKM